MAVSAKLYSDDRSAERHDTSLDGTLRTSNWEPIDVQLDDLSLTGCLLSTGTRVEVNELITIGVVGVGMRPARVSRKTGDHLGCEFVVPLTPAELKAALTRPEAPLFGLLEPYFTDVDDTVRVSSMLVVGPLSYTTPAGIIVIALAVWIPFLAIGWLALRWL